MSQGLVWIRGGKPSASKKKKNTACGHVLFSLQGIDLLRNFFQKHKLISTKINNEPA